MVRGSDGGGAEDDKSVRVVCRGREGSQDSICKLVNVNDLECSGIYVNYPFC